jgi:hypothetical protein
LTAALCGGAGFKMSHLHFFDGNMQKHAAEALGLAIEKLDELHAAADILASRKAPVNLVLEYIGRLGGAKLLEAAVVATDATQKIHKGNGSALDAAIDATVAEKHFQQIKEADLNKVGKVFLDSILASPGSDLAAARGTWWGAFNGITHACDFRLGHTADSRLSSAWFGERENTKNKALAMAVEYAQRVN